MTQNPNTKSRPFSLRLTPEERSRLERQAGSRPLGEYIRSCLLGGQQTKRRASRAQFPTKDRQAIAKVLALLGKSSLGASLAKFAESARIGALPVTEETELMLRRACADIAAIKSLIMKALGIQED